MTCAPYRRTAVPPWRGYFDHVTEALADLQRVPSKAVVDLNNLEATFTTIELASLINKLPGQSQDFIPDIANALRAVIVHTIESDMRLGAVDGQNTATQVYGRFARFLKKLHQPKPPGQIAQTIAVITFKLRYRTEYWLYGRERTIHLGAGEGFQDRRGDSLSKAPRIY
jgi:hypothetical protein